MCVLSIYSLDCYHRSSSHNILRPVALRLEAVTASGVRLTSKLDFGPIQQYTGLRSNFTYRTEVFTASNFDAVSSNVAVRGVISPEI